MSVKISIKATTSLLVYSMLLLGVFVGEVSALPWDIDMFRQESLKSSEIARSPVPGTIPLGYKPFTMNTEEADKQLKNPIAISRDSVWRGKRIWNANCVPCHSKTGDGKGPVGPLMGVPDLNTDFYRARSDGRFFAVLHHGGANMPRYGYKFSENEKWDVINYLRFLQGTKVDGVERP